MCLPQFEWNEVLGKVGKKPGIDEEPGQLRAEVKVSPIALVILLF
jgi:hypothetical protein